jgi:hypothetical protein
VKSEKEKKKSAKVDLFERREVAHTDRVRRFKAPHVVGAGHSVERRGAGCGANVRHCESEPGLLEVRITNEKRKREKRKRKKREKRKREKERKKKKNFFLFPFVSFFLVSFSVSRRLAGTIKTTLFPWARRARRPSAAAASCRGTSSSTCASLC